MLTFSVLVVLNENYVNLTSLSTCIAHLPKPLLYVIDLSKRRKDLHRGLHFQQSAMLGHGGLLLCIYISTANDAVDNTFNASFVLFSFFKIKFWFLKGIFQNDI